MATKYSQFPQADGVESSDAIVGLHNGGNSRFTFATVLAWLRQQFAGFFVPSSRTVNGKDLSDDISLTAADVGAQDEILVNGILKGDGQGGISAAQAGTDYGTYSKPSGGIPASDMTSAVQTSLNNADTAYQKPSGGIPASDLANGVIPAVPSPSDSAPQDLASTAAAGSSGNYSRADHVHKMPSASDVGALAVDGTAVASQRMVRISALEGTGWYKFFEYTSPGNNNGVGMTFIIKETYSANTIGIINFYMNFTSSGGFTCYFNNIATTFATDKLKYKRDGYKISLYYNKTTNDVGDTGFILLTSHYRNGNYWDTTACWMAVLETPDSSAVNVSNTIQNKAQYAISDTNGDQIDTTYLKSAEAANTYLPAASVAVQAYRLANVHALTGNAGWYKIIEFTIETANNSARNFLITAMETDSTYVGIVKVHFRRTSSTNIQAYVRWSVVDGLKFAGLAYSVNASTGVCSVYYQKMTANTYRAEFQCINAWTRNTAIAGADIPWVTTGTTAPLSALPDDAVMSSVGPVADRAYRLVNILNFTGAAGWYKIFEVTISTVTGYNFTLMINEGPSGRGSILMCSCRRISATSAEAFLRWLVEGGGTDATHDAQYTLNIVDGNATFALYIRKRNSSSYGISVQILRSTSLNGGSYSLLPYFISSPTATTLPSNAVSALPPTGILYYENQTISTGTNAQLLSISASEISDAHVLSKIDFANPEYITTGYTWTTEEGSFKLVGTCTAATTANILLVRKGN